MPMAVIAHDRSRVSFSLNKRTYKQAARTGNVTAACMIWLNMGADNHQETTIIGTPD